MTDVTTEKNATDDTQWSIMPAISSAELGLPPLDHDQVWMDQDGRMPDFQRSRLNSEKFKSKSQNASFSFGVPTNQRFNFDALG